jgi:hypothetical protein
MIWLPVKRFDNAPACAGIVTDLLDGGKSNSGHSHGAGSAILARGGVPHGRRQVVSKSFGLDAPSR